MKKFYVTSKLFLTCLIVCALTLTKGFAQVGTDFFPVGGLNTWSTNVFTELNFYGAIPVNSPPAQIATTFGGLTSPAANVNDFTGLKLTFSAYVSSDGSKNTNIVLASNANWGGQGVVIEINRFQIQAINNFDYTDFNFPPKSFSQADNAGYQNLIRQDQYNSFIIDVSATGLITITVNGTVLADTYQADITVLQAPGARFALFATAFSGFQLKNLKAERAGITQTYFTSEFSTKYAQSSTDWTIDANNELNFNGSVPGGNPAVVETTFGSLTATATANDYTGLKLTFQAYVSSTGANTSVVLSSNGSWGLTTSRGILIAINRFDVRASSNFGTTSTVLSSDPVTTNYTNNIIPDAYNSFIIDVSAGGVITVTVNGYVCPTTYVGGGPLTAALPNPRYAVFGTEFSGFKLKNLITEKGGISRSYFTSTLPVTLVKFDAAKRANGSLLNWETATETNNSHFIVSRSVDGVNFKELSKITGKGQASKYQYLDAAPVSGNNYYKLVQFDFDGKSEVLGFKNLNFDLETARAVTIYPKPADKFVNLSFNRALEGNVSVKLFDLSGRERQNVVITAQKEAVNYVLNFNQAITSGSYIIKISAGAYQQVEKLLVK